MRFFFSPADLLLKVLFCLSVRKGLRIADENFVSMILAQYFRIKSKMLDYVCRISKVIFHSCLTPSQHSRAHMSVNRES